MTNSTPVTSVTFTDKLRESTKDSHKVVDRHPFVSLIKTNKCAGKIYVNFNKICINMIQETLQNTPKSFFHKNLFKESIIYKKMYRHIEPLDFFISNNLLILLDRCEKYPLEHSYMFYLGIIMGGNLLTKFIPESKDFFKYTDVKQLVQEFKDFLNEVITKEKQEKFIKIVNESYSIIKLIFDDYNNLLEKNIKNCKDF